MQSRETAGFVEMFQQLVQARGELGQATLLNIEAFLHKGGGLNYDHCREFQPVKPVSASRMGDLAMAVKAARGVKRTA